jgi:hypothetical protein
MGARSIAARWLPAALLASALAAVPAQTRVPEWTWMGGSVEAGDPGTYGTKYEFAEGNLPGGSAWASEWTDQSGRLWLFGGDYSNDLWVFDPAQGTHGEWAWMGGSIPGCPGDGWCEPPSVYGKEYAFAAGNIPGGRTDAVSWSTPDGRMWLFGGAVAPTVATWNEANDLWVFDPKQGAHGEWAWMGGNKLSFTDLPGIYGTEYQFASTNRPGGRWESVSWTDPEGRLWMFGGAGFDSSGVQCILDDLWVFDPAQGAHGEWAWMGGSKTVRTSGIYGTEFKFAPGNTPGSRATAFAWTEKSGKVWLFGGQGYDSAGNEGYLNDLWVFDPAQGAHGEWAWMGGSDTVPVTCTAGYAWCGRAGSYGARYEFAAANNPGGRVWGVPWADPKGHLWLLGGQGYDAAGTEGLLNDLWEFDPSAGAHGEWAWMGGGGTVPKSCPSTSSAGYGYCGRFGSYGTEYEPALANFPGGRQAGTSWVDVSGNLWLFGGDGYGAQGYLGSPNDLWQFKMVTTQTIDFPQLETPVTLGTKPIKLAATATSHLGVTFRVASGPGKVSGTNGSTLTIIGAGTIVVGANQAGNEEFAAAPQVSQKIVVKP